MKKMLTALLLIASLSAFASGGGHADKEPIVGSGFDLVLVNGIIVGTYNLIPIWAEKKCGSHIRGTYKVGEEIKNFAVQKVDGKLTGTFGDRKVLFAGLDKPNKKIMVKFNDETIIVTWEAESFENGHYHNVDLMFGDFNINIQGEACLGSLIFYSLFFTGLTS